MSFEHDLFISYAHIDNESPMQDGQGWVSSFHRAVEVRVAQLLGARLDVWRDPKLSGNDVFAETLVDKLRAAALLVSVVSPSYVNSVWCRRELEAFVKASEGSGGITIGDKARIFKVVKTPPPDGEFPPDLQPLLGYPFYEINPETGRATEFNQMFGEKAQHEFWLRLDDLAHDIVDTLALVEPPGKPVESESSIATQDLPVVYLAETTADLREARDELKRDLQRSGYRVLPEQPFPLTSPEFDQFVAGQLQQCRLSIHLVGSRYGLVTEGASKSIVELQHEGAQEREQAGLLTRLVWIHAVSAPDDRSQQLLAALRSGAGLTAQSDVFESPLQQFKLAVKQRLEALPKNQPEPGQTPSEQDLIRLYVICDRSDLDAVQPAADFLFDQGFEVTLPVFDGDEASVREDHEDNLRVCDGVLIYYGAGSQIWLRRKIRDLAKIAGLGRNRPFTAEAVLVAGPETEEKRHYRTRDVIVVRLEGAFDGSTLGPFCERLRLGAQ